MEMTRTVPKKLTELGRIRIGDREPNESGKGTHPHKLSTFRLTSSNRSLLSFAAQAYGGAVQEWDDEWAPHDEHQRPTQYELYTDVSALDVLIPTFSAISLSFERWSAGGCQQRCTGEVITACPLREVLVGQPCACPVDDVQRADLARTGKACARILRLNVLLDALPGVGVWRLETKGFYATAELMGTLDMLQMAGHEHMIIEAVLRLEQRTVKRPGKGEGKGTLQFAVPTLWPKYTFRQIAAAGQGQRLLMQAPLPTVESATDAAEALFGPGAGMAFLAPPPVADMPPAGKQGKMDPAEFNYRMEALWREAGFDAEAITERWEQVMKQCRATNGRIREDWYPRLLEEQARLMEKRKTLRQAEQYDEPEEGFGPLGPGAGQLPFDLEESARMEVEDMAREGAGE